MNRAWLLALALAIPWSLARADDAPNKEGAVAKFPWKVEGQFQEDDPRDKVMQKSPHRVFAVKLTAGTIYRIDLTSSDFDSYLRLEDSTGKQLAADDDGGGFLHARITFKVSKDGIYRVITTNLDGKTGQFTLAVDQASGATAQLEMLKTEFQTTAQGLIKEFRETKSEEAQEKIKSRFYEAAAKALANFVRFAEENAKDPASADARKMSIQMLQILSQAESPSVAKQLRLVAAKSTDKEMAGLASLALGKNLVKQYERAYQKKDKAAADLAREAEAFFKETADKYGEIKVGRSKLADQIQDALFELQNLSVGKPALEIEAEDIDGKVFKLSDYRGKVVVLDFWGHW